MTDVVCEVGERGYRGKPYNHMFQVKLVRSNWRPGDYEMTSMDITHARYGHLLLFALWRYGHNTDFLTDHLLVIQTTLNIYKVFAVEGGLH